MHKEVNDVQVSQIREAISNVVTLGPDFLAKKISAEEMARTMVKAVEEYIKKAKKMTTFSPKAIKPRNF